LSYLLPPQSNWKNLIDMMQSELLRFCENVWLQSTILGNWAKR